MPVAILDIDDASIEELGQWPWPRTRIAEMVTLAMQDGAVVVGFDIVFSEPDRLSPPQIVRDNPDLPPDLAKGFGLLPDNDQLLAQAFSRARVIVGQATVRSAVGSRPVKREIEDFTPALIGSDPKPYLLRFPDILPNLAILENAAAGRGMFSTRPDPDGVYRRVPLAMLVQDKIRLGLSPEMLRVATGGGTYAIRTNEAGIEGMVLAQQFIPTARDGTVWPYLTRASRTRYVPVADLLNGNMPTGRLAGHLVLVGTSAIGLEEFRATPLGVPMAGVEIHAQVLENILAKTLLSRPNFTLAVELVVTFALCLLVIFFAPRLRAAALVSSSIVLLGGYSAISYLLFYEYRVLLDPTFPVIATLLAVMLISTVNYLREERQRREIRNAFGQYVSPVLVDQLSRNQSKLTLGGELRDLSLLFSDVRGFTAIAEDYRDDPQALTQLMNEFLTILSKAIMDQGGTIDKFMGDAVMAFWNAPLDTPDHTTAACRASLRMISDVESFNAARALSAQTRPAERKLQDGYLVRRPANLETVHEIKVGIGINSGPCIVGNMGSSMRFDYTALGDPVNVASRLEGQSRFYGAPIILGKKSARAVMSKLALMELDVIRVVGKEIPERIYALLGDEIMRGHPRFASAFERNAQMHVDYHAQDWNAVDAALPALRDDFDALEVDLQDYLDIYRTRVLDLRLTPPAPDWNGVFASTQK